MNTLVDRLKTSQAEVVNYRQASRLGKALLHLRASSLLGSLDQVKTYEREGLWGLLSERVSKAVSSSRRYSNVAAFRRVITASADNRSRNATIVLPCEDHCMDYVQDVASNLGYELPAETKDFSVGFSIDSFHTRERKREWAQPKRPAAISLVLLQPPDESACPRGALFLPAVVLPLDPAVIEAAAQPEELVNDLAGLADIIEQSAYWSAENLTTL